MSKNKKKNQQPQPDPKFTHLLNTVSKAIMGLGSLESIDLSTIPDMIAEEAGQQVALPPIQVDDLAALLKQHLSQNVYVLVGMSYGYCAYYEGAPDEE